MGRSEFDRVSDILAAIADIRSDTEGMTRESFVSNRTVARSVLFSIGVIGEAVKRLGSEVTEFSPNIPWRAISGMRDRVVHEYFRMSMDRVWDVVVDDLDPLEAALRGWLEHRRAIMDGRVEIARRIRAMTPTDVIQSDSAELVRAQRDDPDRGG